LLLLATTVLVCAPPVAAVIMCDRHNHSEIEDSFGISTWF
jgi:hypothetical protein